MVLLQQQFFLCPSTSLYLGFAVQVQVWGRADPSSSHSVSPFLSPDVPFFLSLFFQSRSKLGSWTGEGIATPANTVLAVLLYMCTSSGKEVDSLSRVRWIPAYFQTVGDARAFLCCLYQSTLRLVPAKKSIKGLLYVEVLVFFGNRIGSLKGCVCVCTIPAGRRKGSNWRKEVCRIIDQ